MYIIIVPLFCKPSSMSGMLVGTKNPARAMLSYFRVLGLLAASPQKL